MKNYEIQISPESKFAINLTKEDDLIYWTCKLGVSEDVLILAVNYFGCKVEDVKEHLANIVE